MYITVDEANAYADKNKLIVTSVDVDLETSQATQLFAKLGQVYDVSTWVDEVTTPNLVRKVLAMLYTGWFYERTYSEDQDTSDYGQMLISQANQLIEGIVAGTLVLSDVTVPAVNPDQPSFYPDDASSALTPSFEDRSLGDAKFSMGTIW